MQNKQLQATDKGGESVDEDPVCGTRGRNYWKLRLGYRHKEKPNHRRNLKLRPYYRWKLLVQIPHLSRPQVRLPTPHTNGLTEELESLLLGIHTLDPTFYCPSTPVLEMSTIRINIIFSLILITLKYNCVYWFPSVARTDCHKLKLNNRNVFSHNSGGNKYKIRLARFLALWQGDYQECQKNIWDWWKCSIFWLWWWLIFHIPKKSSFYFT